MNAIGFPRGSFGVPWEFVGIPKEYQRIPRVDLGHHLVIFGMPTDSVAFPRVCQSGAPWEFVGIPKGALRGAPRNSLVFLRNSNEFRGSPERRGAVSGGAEKTTSRGRRCPQRGAAGRPSEFVGIPKEFERIPRVPRNELARPPLPARGRCGAPLGIRWNS